MQTKFDSKEVKRWIYKLRAEIAKDSKSSAIRMRGGVLAMQRSQPRILQCLTPTMRALGNETINFRLEVVKALEAQPNDINLELLSRLAKVERDWQVRKAVAETAAEISNPKAIEILTDLARMDADEDVKKCAAQCLEELTASSTHGWGGGQTKSGVRVRGGEKRIDGNVVDEIKDVLAEIRATDWS